MIFAKVVLQRMRTLKNTRRRNTMLVFFHAMNAVLKLKTSASWMNTLNSVMITENRIKILISEMSGTKNLAILQIQTIHQSAVTDFLHITTSTGLKMKKEEGVDHAGTGVKETVIEEIAVDLPISKYANSKISVTITIPATSSITVNRILF